METNEIPYYYDTGERQWVEADKENWHYWKELPERMLEVASEDDFLFPPRKAFRDHFKFDSRLRINKK